MATHSPLIRCVIFKFSHLHIFRYGLLPISALLNNTAMNILMRWTFFINFLYECLVGKGNWEI